MIKHITKLNKSAKYRFESGEFIAEGARVCYDAYLSDAQISALVYTEKAYSKNSSLIDEISAKAEDSVIVTEKLFSVFSDTRTPQGVLCVIKTLDKSALFDKMKDSGKFLALDNIQDPSNLGTILRTAEAVGIDAVVLSSDCCDIHSPKVVRGSMGAVFRLPYIITDSLSGFLKENSSVSSYAAVVDKNARLLTDTAFNSPCIVCIGNEGNGLKAETIDACDCSVTIPMKGRAESLNASVAASIIMWEMTK